MASSRQRIAEQNFPWHCHPSHPDNGGHSTEEEERSAWPRTGGKTEQRKCATLYLICEGVCHVHQCAVRLLTAHFVACFLD
eukprot:2089753-Pyramimonas_sp.AAC.1